MGTYLSVVIPAYNEADNFKSGVLNAPLKYLQNQKYSWELLCVDDGSTDDTLKLLQNFARKDKRIKVISIPHGGKARPVTAGILAASGEIVLFTDFDQSTPLPQVAKFISAHRSGADVVIGVRSQTEKDSWVRKMRSWVFLTLVQTVALPGIRDSQCGFKSFTRPAAQKVFSRLAVSLPEGRITGGYMGAFDVEVLFLARKFGFKIAQLPVDWIKYPSNRLNVWKEPLKMALDTSKIRLWDILGKYGQV